MENIIKTIAGKSEDKYVRYIDLLLDVEKRVLISPQEEALLEYMRESLENSGVLPSVEYLADKFPEFKVPFDNAKELSESDLKVEYANLINKRTNLNISKDLMQIATEVTKGGLTYEHMDKIRQYLNIVDVDDVKDYTDSPESFKEFYNKKKEQPIGMLTYIKQVDEAIGGIGYGMMADISAYTSSFKTVWANNIAYKNTRISKYNICYISLEVPKEDLLINQLARHSFEQDFDKYPFIANKKIRDCVLSDEEEEYLMGEVLEDYFDYEKYGMLKILDETDFKTFSFGEIRHKLEEVDDEMKEKTGYGLDGVVVDHVNLFKFTGNGQKFQSEAAEGNAYISFFRKLGLAFRKDEDGSMRKLMIVILSQINRTGKAKADKNKGRYNLNALAEFNEIERGSQVVLTIYTNPEMKEGKEATVQLLKNRNGQTIDDPVSVYADGEAYVFGDDMEGFSDMISMTDMDDVFESGLDISSLI